MIRKMALATMLMLAPEEATASQASDAIIAYVSQYEPRFNCLERAVGNRRFVHCRSSPACATPNLLFEIRGGLAVWANGKTQTFVETHKRYPMPIVDGRPLPYSTMDIFESLGYPAN